MHSAICGYMPAHMTSSSCHCTILRKATRKVSAYYDEALVSLGINIAQLSLMRNIARIEPTSLTELAARVELDRSTVGRNIKVLERMGLVAIITGKDHREVVLELSQSGRKILREGNAIWDRVQDDINARLGADHMKQLHGLLARL